MYIPSSGTIGFPLLRNLGILVRTLSRKLSWLLLLTGFLAVLLSRHWLLVLLLCSESGPLRFLENQKDSDRAGSDFEELSAMRRRGRSCDGGFAARLLSDAGPTVVVISLSRLVTSETTNGL